MPFIVFIVWVCFAFSADAQYQILDVQTQQPVPYAHVQVPQQAKGVLATYEGWFYLDAAFSEEDSLLISCIGYEDTLVLVKNLAFSKKINLSPSPQQLSTITVSAQKLPTKIKQLGIRQAPRKKQFSTHVGTAKNGEERAVWIPNPYSMPGKLKNIQVFVTDLGYPNAHFRVHVYACHPLEIQPDQELTSSNLVVAKTGKSPWVTIDLEQEAIAIGENGCFVGIEWFDAPDSKPYKDTIYNKGYAYEQGDKKDTVYTRIRTGNGVVIGAVLQNYRHSQNKMWYKKQGSWKPFGYLHPDLFYTYDTLPNGEVIYTTPDNHYQGILGVKVAAAFPKQKIEKTYKAPKKRRLNKIQKTKLDLIQYPQASVAQLFSSLTKAFEQDDFLYIFQYLCVYKEEQLQDILQDLGIDSQQKTAVLPEEEKARIIHYLQAIQEELPTAQLEKINYQQFRLHLKEESYLLTVDKGLWKINPYSYRIYQ